MRTCTHTQTDVGEFLESIELTQYLPIFKTEGYYLPDDVENLIGLTVHDLKEMGITKKGVYCHNTHCNVT